VWFFVAVSLVGALVLVLCLVLLPIMCKKIIIK